MGDFKKWGDPSNGGGLIPFMNYEMDFMEMDLKVKMWRINF